MTKFGSTTNPANPIVEEIKRIAGLGFDFVEIGIEEPGAGFEILEQQKAKILGLLKRNKIFALGHTGYWEYYNFLDEDSRKLWVAIARNCVSAASDLGLKLLNFHFYAGSLIHYPNTKLGKRLISKSSAIRRFVSNYTRSMNEVVKYARRKKVSIMMENMPIRTYGIKEFSSVVRNVPGLLVHLDIGHAFDEGGMTRIKEYVEKFSDKISHIHLHDDLGFHQHLPIGEGKIDFRKVVEWLKQINYDKTFSFEVFSSNRDLVESRNLFKKLWNGSRVIQTRSIRRG